MVTRNKLFFSYDKKECGKSDCRLHDDDNKRKQKQNKKYK